MPISKYPSKVHLPQNNRGWDTVLDYLVEKFQSIDKNIWQERIINGKIHWHDGSLIYLDTPFRPHAAVYYYREVAEEPIIPFKHKILYQDEHILIADKPHFLPVTPGGIYVNECLQHRLRTETEIDELQALHRIDRETAGLVMFSVNPETRANYHTLFSEKTITKTYQAIAETSGSLHLANKQWEIKNKMVKSNPSFLMTIDYKAKETEFNTHSEIKCVKQHRKHSVFELLPITGKTHQLRVHMQSIGYPIMNDKFYPVLLPKEENYSQPLQLLAKSLKFKDPISNEQKSFDSTLKLACK